MGEGSNHEPPDPTRPPLPDRLRSGGGHDRYFLIIFMEGAVLFTLVPVGSYFPHLLYSETCCDSKDPLVVNFRKLNSQKTKSSIAQQLLL